MKTTLIALSLLVTACLAYSLLRFIETKNDCEAAVIEATTAFYEDPGAGAALNAAVKAAYASDACVKTKSYATFVAAIARGK